MCWHVSGVRVGPHTYIFTNKFKEDSEDSGLIIPCSSSGPQFVPGSPDIPARRTIFSFGEKSYYREVYPFVVEDAVKHGRVFASKVHCEVPARVRHHNWHEIDVEAFPRPDFVDRCKTRAVRKVRSMLV